MQQADQRGELLIHRRVRTVIRQQDLNRLARCEQAHRLTKREEGVPVGVVVQLDGVVFIEALRGGGVPHGIKAFLKQ